MRVSFAPLNGVSGLCFEGDKCKSGCQFFLPEKHASGWSCGRICWHRYDMAPSLRCRRHWVEVNVNMYGTVAAARKSCSKKQ